MSIGGAISDTWKKAGGDISRETKNAGGAVSDAWKSMTGNKQKTPKIDESAFAPTDGIKMDPNEKAVASNAANVNMGAANDLRGEQLSLIQALQAQAAGQGPSLATEQLKQAQQQNLAQTMAMMASQRGGANPAMARQAMNQNQQIQAQTAPDATTSRIQEQMGARDQLAGVLQNARATDADLAKYQAGLQQESNMTDAQLASRFQELRLAYLQAGQSAQEADRLAAIELQKLKLDASTMPKKGNSLMSALGPMAVAAGTVFGGPIGGAAAAGAVGAINNANS